MEPEISRKEFINGYFSRQKPHNAFTTREGYKHGNRVFVAQRCECGAPGCRGWRMAEAALNTEG